MQRTCPLVRHHTRWSCMPTATWLTKSSQETESQSRASTGPPHSVWIPGRETSSRYTRHTLTWSTSERWIPSVYMKWKMMKMCKWINQLSYIMRLWHFSSSINSFFKHAYTAIQCLIFGRTFRLLPYFMCVNSEGSGETAQMRRLAWAFAGRLYDKYHNLMMWLNYTECHIKGTGKWWRLLWDADAAEYDIWSGSTLFGHINFFWKWNSTAALNRRVHHWA